MLDARRLAGEKVSKQHGLIFRPDAARAAEIGHAGFRADAGAGEEDYGLGSPQPHGEICKVHHLRLSRVYFFCAGSDGFAGVAGALGLAGAAGVAGCAGGGGAG